MRKINKHEGFFALYKGMGASMMGVVPYSSVDLALFFFMKNLYLKKYQDEPNIGNLLLFGALSGMVAQFVAYPFALVRTRLQSQGLPGIPKSFNGILDCFSKTYQKEGLRGLYKGLFPNYMKSIPAVSLNYMVFEKCKLFLKRNTSF